MPLPLTVSCFSKIQIGFTFLVLAYPGSPGKRAATQVYVCCCVTCAAVRIVKVRAKAMQSASQLVSGGMIKVHFGASGRVGKACVLAKTYCKEQLGLVDSVCVVTAYLYPGCKIVSGHREVIFLFVSFNKINAAII